MALTLASLVNHQCRLTARPQGLAKAGDWQFTEAPVAEPGEGGVLVKVLSLSLEDLPRAS